MKQYLIFFSFFTLGACSLLSSEKSEPEPTFKVLSIQELGGFVGISGPYKFRSSGYLLLPYAQDSIALSREDRAKLLQIGAALREMDPYQGVINKVERRLGLDQEIYSWDKEDQEAVVYDNYYRQLYELMLQYRAKAE